VRREAPTPLVHSSDPGARWTILPSGDIGTRWPTLAPVTPGRDEGYRPAIERDPRQGEWLEAD
jgi:hypothetical protein